MIPAEILSECKRASHVLGLEGYAYSSDSLDSDIEIIHKLAGEYSTITRKIIIEKIKAYTPPESEVEIWEAILDSFNRAAVPYESKSSHENKINYTIDDYKNQNIGHITQIGKCGWRGHTINVAFYKSYMIVCNRGAYGKGNKIYKINRDKVNLEDIAALEDYNSRSRSAKDTIKAIDNIAASSVRDGSRRPKEIVKFKTKMQKYGTCSYANLIASIEPMLALGLLELSNELNDQNLQRSIHNRGPYKRFTKFCRDHEVDRIISMLENLNDDDDAVENSRAINFVHMICGKLVSKLSKQVAQPHGQMAPDDLNRFLKLELAVREAEDRIFYSIWDHCLIENNKVQAFFEDNPSIMPLQTEADNDDDTDIEILDEPDIIILNSASSFQSGAGNPVLYRFGQTDSLDEQTDDRATKYRRNNPARR